MDDNVKLEMDGFTIHVYKKLSAKEVENLFYDIFGTCDVGMIDIESLKDNVYFCPICDHIFESEVKNEFISCPKCRKIINTKGI